MTDTSLQKRPGRNWQEWLEWFAHYASVAGWQDFVQSAIEAGVAPAVVAPAYAAPLQTALANAMLCACLQLDESDALAAIQHIARQGRQIHFEKSPRALSKELRALYRASTRNITRMLPGVADLFEQVFIRYARGDYDDRADANALLSQARSLMADRAAALDAMSRAGVAMLRGASVWLGWTGEGSPEFRQWALSLFTLTDTLGQMGALGQLPDERARAAERIAVLSADASQQDDEGYALLNSPDDMDRITDTWFELVERDEPLGDDDIRALGDRYKPAAELAARIVWSARMLTLPDSALDDDVDEDGEEDAAGQTLGVAVDVLGILRYGPPSVITALIGMVAGDNPDTWPWDLPGRAVTALQRIGAPALEQSFDFVRYSERQDARMDMLRVLGVAGRGHEEVYQYLANEFDRATWAKGKRAYALPLALLHDPRATPLIVAALRDPAVDDEDAWELLDALQELGVTFYVNKDQRAVNIPDYGIIEDVLPDDWQSRAELQALDKMWIDFGLDYDDDDDDYDDVVYDADGTPRCPDCGQEMHYVNGRWVHELPPAAPKRPKSKSRY